MKTEEEQEVRVEGYKGMDLWRALDAKVKLGLDLEASGF